jgi:cytochrome oxidase Cu insertion factor (SCO1/SenC/PrrC family)
MFILRYRVTKIGKRKIHHNGYHQAKTYLAALSPDFIGLTGDPKTTSKIAARFAAVFFKEPAAKDGSYNVMHSTQVFAVDKAGRLRATFVDASTEDMATITDLLLKEPG